MKKTAFIRNGGKIYEYYMDASQDGVRPICKRRVHDDYMTAQFVNEASKDKDIIEYECSYEEHKKLLDELFNAGFVGVFMQSGTRVFVKRNYIGSVRKVTSFQSISDTENIQWGVDERSSIIKKDMSSSKIA